MQLKGKNAVGWYAVVFFGHVTSSFLLPPDRNVLATNGKTQTLSLALISFELWQTKLDALPKNKGSLHGR